jgi:hypothetical protein
MVYSSDFGYPRSGTVRSVCGERRRVRRQHSD